MDSIINITLDLIRYHLPQHPRYELDHSPWSKIQENEMTSTGLTKNVRKGITE